MEIVVVTGPAAVGKTTVAKAAQRLLGSPWLLYEVDRCQPAVPPDPAFATLDNDTRMRRANFLAARAYVEVGFRVLVEMDLGDEVGRKLYGEVLSGAAAAVVVLTASRDVVIERARKRGRDLTWIEHHIDRGVWGLLPDSVVLDASTCTVDELAQEVAGLARE